MPGQAGGPSINPHYRHAAGACRIFGMARRIDVHDEAAAHGGRGQAVGLYLNGLVAADCEHRGTGPIPDGGGGGEDHGKTLPDCVVLTTRGFLAGAGGAVMVTTTVIGVGAAASITVAPGGAV